MLLLGQLQSGNRPYVRANVRVVQSLPVFPGAHRTDLFTSRSEQEGRVGYRTEATYALPSGSGPDAALAFYGRRLPPQGWTGGPTLWRRGEEALWLRPGAERGTYSVAVDSRYGEAGT